MKDAWRFVPEGPERERLRDAKGLGTPATRDSVIEGLKHQGLLGLQNGKLVPSEMGIWIDGTIGNAVPELVDPAATARREMQLDGVLEGTATLERVVADVVATTQAFVDALVAAPCVETAPAIKREPTLGMLKTAKAKAEREGLKKLPKGVRDDFDVCRTYLGPLPDKPAGVRPASDKQKGMMRCLVADGHAPPPGYPDKIDVASASAWISLIVKKTANAAPQAKRA